MKNYHRNLFIQLFVLLALSFDNNIYAQTIYQTINSKDFVMKLSGTSTFHDWDMNATSFQIEGKFNFDEGGNKIQSITGLSFLLPVKNLKGDKKKMDESAYKALKAEKHKDIIFKMTTADIKHKQNNKYEITVLGTLNIAGVTKAISMNVICVLNNDKTISCTGSQKLKMTDYQVEPPTFLGLMKTGNDITLDFTFQLKS